MSWTAPSTKSVRPSGPRTTLAFSRSHICNPHCGAPDIQNREPRPRWSKRRLNSSRRFSVLLLLRGISVTCMSICSGGVVAKHRTQCAIHCQQSSFGITLIHALSRILEHASIFLSASRSASSARFRSVTFCTVPIAVRGLPSESNSISAQLRSHFVPPAICRRYSKSYLPETFEASYALRNASSSMGSNIFRSELNVIGGPAEIWNIRYVSSRPEELIGAYVEIPASNFSH